MARAYSCPNCGNPDSPEVDKLGLLHCSYCGSTIKYDSFQTGGNEVSIICNGERNVFFVKNGTEVVEKIKSIAIKRNIKRFDIFDSLGHRYDVFEIAGNNSFPITYTIAKRSTYGANLAAAYDNGLNQSRYNMTIEYKNKIQDLCYAHNNEEMIKNIERFCKTAKLSHFNVFYKGNLVDAADIRNMETMEYPAKFVITRWVPPVDEIVEFPKFNKPVNPSSMILQDSSQEVVTTLYQPRTELGEAWKYTLEGEPGAFNFNKVLVLALFIIIFIIGRLIFSDVKSDDEKLEKIQKERYEMDFKGYNMTEEEIRIRDFIILRK